VIRYATNTRLLHDAFIRRPSEEYHVGCKEEDQQAYVDLAGQNRVEK